MSSKRIFSSRIRDIILKKKSLNGAWNRTLAVMVTLVVVSLVCIFVFFRISTQNMEENIIRSLQHSVEQRQINIDFRLRSVEKVDETLIALIYPYTYSNATLSDQYIEYAELNTILATHSSHGDVSNVRLYLPDSKIYSHQGGSFQPLSSLIASTYLEMAGAQWQETHTIPMVKSPGVSSSPTNVLTVVHTMRQRNNYNALACVLMLDIEISNFDEMLQVDEIPDCFGYLLNHDGVCLASSDESAIRETVISEQMMHQIRQNGTGFITESGRVYVYQQLDHNDWYVVMDYPANILSLADSAQGSAMQIMIIIAMIISLTLVFIFAYNFMFNVTVSRINTSLNALNTNKTPPGDFPQFLYPLHQLERNADQMVLTVKELMETQYQDRIAIAESQMKSLQAQIKPHFLYNTLDIIKWMILDHKNEDAVQMVNSLSKYLRQSINKGPGIIPLQEELELSRTYLSIMQTRFRNRFTVCFEIEDAAEMYQIPKLSLQPLLENALLHGILYCEKPEKELTVRAWVADGSIHIEVEDTGNGMSEEMVHALESGTAGYGLNNVRKRLALFSKDQGEFHIFSREGFGTCIAIRIPAISANQSMP